MNWGGATAQTPSRLFLGRKAVLTLFERAPQSWSGMVLLAPDGFKNAMYRFAVETSVGRACWTLVDRHAEAVRSLIRMMRRCRIIPRTSSFRAAPHGDHAMRQLVSNVEDAP